MQLKAYVFTSDLFHSMVCGPSVSPTFLYSISCTVWCVLLLSWKSAVVYFFTVLCSIMLLYLFVIVGQGYFIFHFDVL